MQNNLAAGDCGGLFGNAKEFQSLAVDGHGMAAGPDGTDGIVCGHFVQIIAGGHPLFVPEQILVPAPTQDPTTPARLHTLQAKEHFLQTAGVQMQRCNGKGLA